MNTYTIAQFFLLLCASGTCIEHGNIVQVPVPAPVVSYTRGPEIMPRAWYEGKLYVLTPETEL